MLITRLPEFFGETVGELRTIVSQRFGDPDRRGQLEPAQEVDAAFVAHVTVDVQEHPARGAVNGREQMETRSFAWHLRQVFDVNVSKAGFVVLGGFLCRDRFSLGLGNHRFQAGHAFALEQTGNAQARGVRIDVLQGNVQ